MHIARTLVPTLIAIAAVVMVVHGMPGSDPVGTPLATPYSADHARIQGRDAAELPPSFLINRVRVEKLMGAIATH